MRCCGSVTKLPGRLPGIGGNEEAARTRFEDGDFDDVPDAQRDGRRATLGSGTEAAEQRRPAGDREIGGDVLSDVDEGVVDANFAAGRAKSRLVASRATRRASGPERGMIAQLASRAEATTATATR